ncbi:hypothetical protein [Thiobacillus sp. 0-1251]|uniref:hypothetical protein n=1 Tax=Thiobacillus sp. 0-1251 TaxID=1895858 RepID=UPI000959CC05|nr:hypothetical protein [Thiobacillus sp. 0-1251]OJY60239.1 MAG: hypothetical protein BGP19_15390 [Thiobacillus sp. 0-1251]
MAKDFDYGKWKSKLLFEQGNYEFLHHFVNDETAVRSHASNYRLKSWSASGEEIESKVGDASGQMKVWFTDHIASGVFQALETLSAQMIVVAASYTEGIVNEFLTCVFAVHPDRMHDYLEWNSESPRGWIPLKLVVESSDRESMLEKLVFQAVSRAASGDTRALLKRLEKLGKLDFPNEVKERLIKLLELRNKIVHEQYKPILAKADVASTFEVADEFLRFCALALVKVGAPVTDPTESLKTN